jgi:hypothetical protein
MAVERPEGLAGEPWASHLRTCAICRGEAASHVRSLAVFQAIEAQALASHSSALAWESFASVLEQQQAAEERARSRAWWSIPLVAAAAGVLAVGGVLGWHRYQEDTTTPARIVRVQPHEQQSMEDMVRWSLERDGQRADSLLTDVVAPNAPGEFGSDWPQMYAWDARELAASVAPQQEAISQALERISPVAGRELSPGGALERRMPPTQPASNRRGRSQPLFRLERGLVPTQVVSYSVND